MPNALNLDKEKLFRDSVHGYISIPAMICNDFVDTPVFQRLRQIEQTSIRVLYPSAHHDRFIHSLGVYHLGRQAFQHLKKNTQRRGEQAGTQPISSAMWDRCERTFQLACLLHDCGHSPFSHTLEDHYDPDHALDDELCAAAGSAAFGEDYEHCAAAPHEKMSAILVLTDFAKTISQSPYNCDPCLAARMILGCLHHSTTRGNARLTQDEKFENCLIQLLNGRAIDVDKLDYILRDTWASGVDNINVDVERLLGGLILTKVGDEYPRLAFASQSLSVLQSAVDARNYLYQWLYSHHKVLYDTELLKRSILALAGKLAPGGRPEAFIRAVFSTKTFRTPVEVGGVKWYLPTDGDIAQQLKLHRSEIPEAEEWLFRQHSRAPLWKTFAEYQEIFAHKSEENRRTIKNNRDKFLAAFAKEKELPEGTFLSADAPMKKVSIERNQIFIEVRRKPVPYTNIFEEKMENSQTYFLVYGKKDVVPESVREDCVKFLVSQE
jgi:HD superfamily phosphohydrolase